MNRVLILTEAGKGIGFGHLTRCKALRDELVLQGHLVDLVIYLKEFKIEKPDFIESNWLAFAATDMIGDSDIVILDSYLVTQEWLCEAAKSDCLVVQIDDYNRMQYPVDLIINPNVFAHNLDYSNQIARWIGGTDYVIIRAPFRNVNIEVRNSSRLNLFITIGGSDFRKMLCQLAKWAANHDNYDIRLVAPDGAEVNVQGVKVLPLLQAEEMVEEMKRADVVISGCGQTLHELAALKKPTIGICLDKDQEPNHKFYNETGFIHGNLLWNQDDLQQKIKDELTRLANFTERQKASRIHNGINTNGTFNVVKAIIESI